MKANYHLNDWRPISDRNLRESLNDFPKERLRQRSFESIAMLMAIDSIAIEMFPPQVDGTVNRLLSMARAYPDLKANQAYQTLMGQIEAIENDLQHKRQTYNDRVRSYNTACTSRLEVLKRVECHRLSFKQSTEKYIPERYL